MSLSSNPEAIVRTIYSLPVVKRRLIAKDRAALKEAINTSLKRGSDSILFEHGDVRITRRQARLLIESITDKLKQITQKHDRVAVVFPTSAAQGIAIIACMLCDRIPVIVNPSLFKDPAPTFIKQIDVQLAMMLDTLTSSFAKVPHLLINSSGYISAYTPRQSNQNLRQFSVKGSEIEALRQSARSLATLFSPEAMRTTLTTKITQKSTALVVLTSGSTGKPKAVAISLRAISFIVEELIDTLNLNARTTAVLNMPLFHTMVLNTQFLPTFIAGGKCIFSPAELSLNRLYRSIESSKGNYVALVPDLLSHCYEEFTSRGLAANDAVKNVVVAGGSISNKHIEKAQKLFPSAKIHKGYGLTEAIRVSMISSDDEGFYHEGNSGYPLGSQKVEIRSKYGKPLGPNMTGQIWLKGPNVKNSYLQKAFRFDRGFFKTGDIGYLSSDGCLFVLGREDGVFKSQGRKISCQEIETAISSLDSISKARCFPVSCVRKGLKPILTVELSSKFCEDFERLSHEVSEALKSSLESYKVPKQVIVLSSFPLLANGKPDLSELKAVVSGWDYSVSDYKSSGVSFYVDENHRLLNYLN